MKQFNLNQKISFTIEDIPNSMKQQNKILKIGNQTEIYYLNSDSILYIEADGNYCNIHLVDGDVLKTIGFQRAEIARMMDAQLPLYEVSNFALIGRSYLVNLSHIMYINAPQQCLMFDVNHPDSCCKKSIKVSVNALRSLRISLEEMPQKRALRASQSVDITNRGFIGHIDSQRVVLKDYDIDEDEILILG